MGSPKISNPALIYKAVQQIQTVLEDLTFLEYSFGLSETREREKKKYPSVYMGENLDEQSMLPTDLMKSFTFWTKTDPLTPIYSDDTASKNKYANLRYEVSLIFYTFDVKRLGLSTDLRAAKTLVMQEFLKTLQRGLLVCQSDLIINQIYDADLKEIYRGYDVKDMKQPQYAIRFDCQLSFNESCFQ